MGFSPGLNGESSIAGSNDVALNIPTTNDVLSYDGSTSKWKNAAITSLIADSNADFLTQQIALANLKVQPIFVDTHDGVGYLGGDGVNRGIEGPTETCLHMTTPIYQKDQFGNLPVQRATTNRLPNPTFSGALVGALGAGGSLPTGMTNGGQTNGWVVNQVGTGANNEPFIDITVTRIAAISQLSGPATVYGVTIGGNPAIVPGIAPSRGFWVRSALLEVISASGSFEQAYLEASTFSGTGVSYGTVTSVAVTPEMGQTRVSAAMPVTVTSTDRIRVSFNLQVDSTADFSVTFRITAPQIEDGTGANDFTNWTAGTRADTPLFLGAPAGDYSVGLIGPNGSQWADVTSVYSNPAVSPWTGPGVLLPTTQLKGSVSARYIVLMPKQTAEQKRVIVDAIYPVTYGFLGVQSAEVVLSNMKWSLENPSEHSYVTTIATNRTQIERYEIRPGDHDSYDDATSNTNQRSETMQKSLNGQDVRYPFDTFVNFSGAFCIENPAIDGAFRIIGQWHQSEDANDPHTSPIMGIAYFDDSHQKRLRITALSSTTDGVAPTGSTIYESAADFPVGKDVWHYIYMRVKFSKTGHGYIEIWLDGTRVVYQTDIPFGTNDALGPYFKKGIYKAHSEIETTVVKWANFEVGLQSSLDLSSRATDPLAIT